jgi:hypothetical protein
MPESDFERLLTQALQPIEPPEDLASGLEETLSAVTQLAAEELSGWELEAMRDPRNWLRPAIAVAAGSAAATGLLLLELRRRRQPSGLRAFAAQARSRISG